MKNFLTIVLVLVTVASLGFGYYQSTEAKRFLELAERSESVAKMQEMIASEMRAAAEKAMEESRVARAVAEARANQALADCQKRRK